MKTLLLSLILTYHGYVYETAGELMAFFPSSEEAHQYAEKAQTLNFGEVHQYGTQVEIIL